jgi:hypothetical protein
MWLSIAATALPFIDRTPVRGFLYFCSFSSKV